MLIKGVALLGGSFNPPTLSHEYMIRQSAARAEKLIVMPAAISPFKIDAKRIPGEDRAALLSEMCANVDNVEISRYELDEQGVSYTCKTLEHLSKTHATLTLVLGSDNIFSLTAWRDYKRIFSLASLYIVPRQYFPVTQKCRDFLDGLGCRYTIADFTCGNESSTIVPLAKAFGKLRETVPECVARYIEEKGIFNDYENIVELYDRFNVKQSRREHIFRTAKAAVSIAQLFGANAAVAVKAAALHDVGKYVTVQSLTNQGYAFDDGAFRCPPSVEHCFTGEAIARADAKIEDEEILRAIRLHTTGDADMTPLEKTIFCADYLEEGRTTPGVERIREKMCVSPDGAMLMILDDTINYLTTKKAEIDERTIACRDWLRKITQKGE